MRQYFLTGFGGEAAMLEHARTWLDDATHLVTFNGKCFDVPLLATRYRLMRLPTPLRSKGHLDLLHPTRAAFGEPLAGLPAADRGAATARLRA